MSARRAVGAAVLVVAALVVIGALAVDAVARSAMEDALSRTFGTEATVETVDVGLLSGEVTAEGIVVANPEGFGSSDFAALARTRATTGLADLLGDTVTVRLVELDGLELRLQRDGAETNFLPILRSMKSARGEGGSGGKRFRVRELVLRGTVARVRPGAGGEERTVEVPQIRLTDLGSGGGALPLGRIAAAALEAALRGALSRPGGLPGAVSGLLGGELGGPGELPGRLDLPAPAGGGEGAADRVRDALESVLPGASDSGG